MFALCISMVNSNFNFVLQTARQGRTVWNYNVWNDLRTVCSSFLADMVSTLWSIYRWFLLAHRAIRYELSHTARVSVWIFFFKLHVRYIPHIIIQCVDVFRLCCLVVSHDFAPRESMQWRRSLIILTKI